MAALEANTEVFHYKLKIVGCVYICYVLRSLFRLIFHLLNKWLANDFTDA